MEPFVYKAVTKDGQKVYEGFCIDLMDKLSEILGFSYTISLVEDGQFGGQIGNSWTGLVGDLVEHVSNIHAIMYIYIIMLACYNISEI